MQPQTITIPAGPIRYREQGNGPPIVFLHGIVANGVLWRRVVPRLAADRRCIVPDWPLGSHELGLNSGADLSLPGLADIVGDFLDALDLEGVTLVANDTGGAIAQWVAVRRPARPCRAGAPPRGGLAQLPPLPVARP